MWYINTVFPSEERYFFIKIEITPKLDKYDNLIIICVSLYSYQE